MWNKFASVHKRNGIVFWCHLDSKNKEIFHNWLHEVMETMI
jgi:hypothetical protein